MKTLPSGRSVLTGEEAASGDGYVSSECTDGKLNTPVPAEHRALAA